MGLLWFLGFFGLFFFSPKAASSSVFSNVWFRGTAQQKVKGEVRSGRSVGGTSEDEGTAGQEEQQWKMCEESPDRRLNSTLSIPWALSITGDSDRAVTATSASLGLNFPCPQCRGGELSPGL